MGGSSVSVALAIVVLLIGLGWVTVYFRDRLAGREAGDPPTPGQVRLPQPIKKLQPGRIEIIPSHLFGLIASGTLETTVDGTVQCWNYASDGLGDLGRRRSFLRYTSCLMRRSRHQILSPYSGYCMS